MQEDLVPLTTDKLRLLGIYLKNCPEWNIAEQVKQVIVVVVVVVVVIVVVVVVV